MANLSTINKILRDRDKDVLAGQIFKANPFLDYLRGADLRYVYERAKHYGYKSWRDSAKKPTDLRCGSDGEEHTPR